MLKGTRHTIAKTLFGLVAAATLVGGLGIATVAAAGPPDRSRNPQGSYVEALGIADLSDAEVQGILFMREEEKLARDVYQTLFEIWELPVFENIAGSEQTHMDALKTLIDRYDLEDPVAGNDVGQFTDSTLQELYDALVAKGRESLVSALRVGAAIEEIDIRDLQLTIDETEALDVLRVYGNLLRGSRNHLRAFVGTLESQTGETYEPQYLDEAEYEEIMAAQMENGRRAGRAGRQAWSGSPAGSGGSQSTVGTARGYRGNGAGGARQGSCIQ